MELMRRSESAAAREEDSVGRKVPVPPKKLKDVVVHAAAEKGREERIQSDKEEGYLAKAKDKYPVWQETPK